MGLLPGLFSPDGLQRSQQAAQARHGHAQHEAAVCGTQEHLSLLRCQFIPVMGMAGGRWIFGHKNFHRWE